MEKSTKIIIGVVAGLAVGTGIVLAVKRSKRIKKEKEDLLRAVEEQKNLSAQQLKELEEKLNNASEEEKEQLTEELMTDIGNVIVGKYAYPKGYSEDWAKGGTVNVRRTPYVNDGYINNLIYENYSNKVGLITAVVNSTEYGDKKKWYKVKLDTPFNGWTFNANDGYVREDAITVKNL